MPKAYIRGHGSWVEGEKERERTLLWALHLFRSEGRMDRISKLHSLLVNLKFKSRCQGVKGEQWVTAKVSYLISPGLSVKGAFTGEQARVLS